MLIWFSIPKRLSGATEVIYSGPEFLNVAPLRCCLTLLTAQSFPIVNELYSFGF
jgi:hypothetical protein